MLHVNDDSNDEIFRKAADDYFLGAGNADFDKFISSADDAVMPPTSETVISARKRKPRYFFPAFEWAHNKIRRNWPCSLFRIVMQHLWYGKTKKKIEPGFMLLCLLFTDSRFFT